MDAIFGPNPAAGAAPFSRERVEPQRDAGERALGLRPRARSADGVDARVGPLPRGADGDCAASHALHEVATHALEAAKNAFDPMRSLREVADDIANRGWQSSERFIATGRVEFRRSSADDVDAHRAAVRSKIGAVADVPGLTGPQRAIATAFRDYDRLPHAVRGALDAALDATFDPLTYATLGRESMERAGLSALDFIERRLSPSIVNLVRTHSLPHPNFALPHGSIDSGRFIRGIGELDDSTLLKAKSAAGARRDLRTHETAGGHSRVRHSGKSDNWLSNDLKQFPENTSASTFINDTVANRALGAFVKRHRLEISQWLARDPKSSPTLSIRFDYGKPVGRVLERSRSHSAETTELRVVLKRDASAQGWFFFTAFPIMK